MGFATNGNCKLEFDVIVWLTEHLHTRYAANGLDVGAYPTRNEAKRMMTTAVKHDDLAVEHILWQVPRPDPSSLALCAVGV